ncbi:MAG: flagellar motor switch protein FliN [Rhodospirillaceae bacterium]|nr:flagellar motor switch protein FliN [Rhodospirillaceae bacterium]MDH5771650.1 flagellar motor switch protein FliN [Rhodospirillaceae bacterium]
MSDDNFDGESEDQQEALLDVPLEVTAVLGTSYMKVSQLLKMGRGAVVQLDRSVGEDIEIRANGNLIARGEVVVVEDHLAVTMTKIIKTQIKS